MEKKKEKEKMHALVIWKMFSLLALHGLSAHSAASSGTDFVNTRARTHTHTHVWFWSIHCIHKSLARLKNRNNKTKAQFSAAGLHCVIYISGPVIWCVWFLLPSATEPIVIFSWLSWMGVDNSVFRESTEWLRRVTSYPETILCGVRLVPSLRH